MKCLCVGVVPRVAHLSLTARTLTQLLKCDTLSIPEVEWHTNEMHPAKADLRFFSAVVQNLLFKGVLEWGKHQLSLLPKAADEKQDEKQSLKCVYLLHL